MKLLSRVEAWVESNLDELYNSQPLREKFLQMTVAVRGNRPLSMSVDEYQRVIFKDCLLKFVSAQVIPASKKLRKRKLAELLESLDSLPDVLMRETMQDRQVEKLAS